MYFRYTETGNKDPLQMASFGDTKNDRIRDQILVGLKDEELSLELQLKDDLSLAEAVRRDRSSELVKQNVQ